MLPQTVLEELKRVEDQSGGELYRTRIAAKVLCDWAQQQQHNAHVRKRFVSMHSGGKAVLHHSPAEL
jgi:hypothetical protein